MEPLDATSVDPEPNDTGDEEHGAWRGLTVGCVSGLIGFMLLLIVLVIGVWYTYAKAAVNTERQTTVPDSPEQWNNAAWFVVREPRRSPEDYAAALKQAEKAVQAAPDNGNFINTLGVAQYRMGQYAEALTTLTKSDKLNATKNGSIPADLAFLAMVRFQLGQKEEARAALTQLQAMMRNPRRIRDRESHAFLQEAEGLIEGDTAEKK